MSRLLSLFVLATMLGMSGCASISKDECLAANWQDVGIRDGASGRPEEYLIRHNTACAKVGVTPDRDAWQRGREQGLERYCTPQRGFSIGEMGSTPIAGICRNHDEPGFLDGHERGWELHRLWNAVSSMDNEIRDVRATLERDDLTTKEREQLAYRLGQLEYAREIAHVRYQEAEYRLRQF